MEIKRVIPAPLRNIDQYSDTIRVIHSKLIILSLQQELRLSFDVLV
jgi:hypothetical protein